MKPGSKVLCIDSRFPVEIFAHGSILPEEGKVYTISSMRIATDGLTGRPEPALKLIEISSTPGAVNCWFSTWRFIEAPANYASNTEYKEQPVKKHHQKAIQLPSSSLSHSNATAHFISDERSASPLGLRSLGGVGSPSVLSVPSVVKDSPSPSRPSRPSCKTYSQGGKQCG